MLHIFTDSGLFRQPQTLTEQSAALELVITDTGCDNGVDVAIYAEGSGQMVFETVLASPSSKVLLTHGSPETETFWQCLKIHRCYGVCPDVFVTARCRFSPLKIAVSTQPMGQQETRNMRFLGLVNAILSELKVRERGVAAQVVVTHRNPYIN
jgi:hypothetical protein